MPLKAAVDAKRDLIAESAEAKSDDDSSDHTSDAQISRTSMLFAKVIDHPRWCWFVLITMTLVAVGGYVYPTWPTDLRRKLDDLVTTKDTSDRPDDVIETGRGNRRAVRSARVARESLGQSHALVVLRTPELFTRSGAAAFRSVVDALQDLDVVDSVRSLDQAPPLNIFGLPEPILPQGHASEQRFAAAKKKAVSHPLVVGQMLSPDAETVLIEITYDWIYVQEDSDCTTKLLTAARTAAAAFPDVRMQLEVTGSVPFYLTIAENNRSNELKYQLIGYGMILAMAVILFRGLSVVVVVAAAPILGVFWTLGFLRYLDWHDNPFSFVILPVLLSLVGFTDGVHMMVHIRTCMQQGQSPRDACKRTLELVGLACFLTSLTTAIGMGSLALAHHRVVREFGWSCVIGVTATWISVMIVLPLACHTRWSRRFSKTSNRDILDRNLDRIGPLISSIVRHAKAVSILSIVLLIALTGVALTLKPDDRKSSSLPSGSPAQLALAHLDESMGGLDVCTIQIQWSPTDWPEDRVIEIIDRIDASLRAEPLIGHPLSLSRLLAALPGEGAAVDKASMAELLPPPLKLALYSPDGHSAKIVFRCKDLGTAAYKETFERLDESFRALERQNVGLSINWYGDPIWRWKDLYKIVTDLTTSLGTASIVIFAVLGIAFRSLRIGLISIIPNLLPLVASATWLVVTGQPLEVVSVCCFTICLGIAVDDTIHFLARYQEELKRTTNRHQAIESAFQGVGAGMVMTTVVLVAGFSSVLFSETRDHRVFGILGVITLITALLCDLFLLPALLAFFDADPSTERKDEASQAAPQRQWESLGPVRGSDD
jgi:predicted RND superfamily exporter protein